MSGMREALARAGAWLVEPPPVSEPPPVDFVPTDWSFGSPAPKTPDRSTGSVARPVVAVVGLAPGCGATTLARALAATLARRDHTGVAIVAGPIPAQGSSLAVRPASRLAARLASTGSLARATGRLCLTSAEPSTDLARLAPLVLDIPHGAAPSLLPNIWILATPGAAEPALAELAARALKRGGRDPITVVTRPADPARWEGRAFIHLPHSRPAAWMAAAGWEPRGPFGAAVAKLADACEQAAVA